MPWGPPYSNIKTRKAQARCLDPAVFVVLHSPSCLLKWRLWFTSHLCLTCPSRQCLWGTWLFFPEPQWLFIVYSLCGSYSYSWNHRLTEPQSCDQVGQSRLLKSGDGHATVLAISVGSAWWWASDGTFPTSSFFISEVGHRVAVLNGKNVNPSVSS